MENDIRFMNQALDQAKRALAEHEFPVGCVFVLNGAVVAEGNRNSSKGKSNEIDHAEINALRSLLEKEVVEDLGGITVYSTLEPCLMCFSTLIVNGITQIVYGYEDAMGGGTNLPLATLAPLYRTMDIQVRGGVLRKESLALFKTFFAAEGNNYLKDSYLAEYTQQQ